nr:ribonucleases P/MRP protein subunit POP1-like [Cherax quadricarinatus]
MEELPGQCNYLALGAARIQEIKLIVTKLEKCEHGGRAFQNLPRHMQRRTVSSNPKRLPRCLQERHMREGGANVKPSHRPRRKYRRRPSNLLAEYNRRQKDFVWLETHIWHAKRFHMKRQWGYALPDTPTCKGYRATLRAAKTSCLLQDVSYLCCIELEGPSMSLLDGLSCMMQPDSLALLNTSQVQHGQQWISVMLFEPGRQPHCLGDVEFKGTQNSEMSEKQLNFCFPGSGWDIVLAAGWGMSVWMPLVFCGGAAGGQQESQNLNMEMLSPMPPHLLPDTPAGSCYTTWLGEQRRIQFFRRPPASRYNFIKLGVQYPFYAPWKKLLQVWEPGTRDIFVLRDTRLLNGLAQQAGNATKAFKKCILKRKADNDLDEIPCKKLQMSLETTGEISSCSRDDASKGPHTEENPRKSHICDTQSKELPSHRCSIEELQKLSHGCLVMVKLILQYKGILEPCAMIYLPEEEDISTRENTMKPTDRKEDITELLHNDTQSEHRLKLKVEHNKIKGRIQHLRRKARSKVAREKDIVAAIQSGESIKKATADALDKIHEQNKEILAKYSSFQEEMENAWLMKINEPLQCCSRKIMGYIINGNFCQTLGRGAGIGWVALKPLLHFINLCKKISGKNVESNNEVQNDDNTVDAWRYAVLVRNPSSLQYHWAKMVIVVESQ